jgi:hypothetical protein
MDIAEGLLAFTAAWRAETKDMQYYDLSAYSSCASDLLLGFISGKTSITQDKERK